MPLSTTADVETAKSAYDFVVLDADGNEFDLSQRHGKPTLFFNSASSCGLSKPSFECANKLCEKYGRDYGFSCFAFPSASFFQEPLTSAEAKKVGCSTHNPLFPILGKVAVNGDNASPLWKYLQKEKSGFLFTQFIKWNYTSFLCDCEGKVVSRFGPGLSFEDVEASLKKKILVNCRPLSQNTSTRTAANTDQQQQEVATTKDNTAANTPEVSGTNYHSNINDDEANENDKRNSNNSVKTATTILTENSNKFSVVEEAGKKEKKEAENVKEEDKKEIEVNAEAKVEESKEENQKEESKE